jgi:hypothetical protein
MCDHVPAINEVIGRDQVNTQRNWNSIKIIYEEIAEGDKWLKRYSFGC